MKTINRFPKGEIQAPSSKSIAHRALFSSLCYILQNVADYNSAREAKNAITHLHFIGELPLDVRTTISAIETLIDNRFSKNKGKPKPIYAGESGTTYRFIAPLAAAMDMEVIPSPALARRPLAMLDFSKPVPGNVSSQFISGQIYKLALMGESGGDSRSGDCCGGGKIEIDIPLESKGYVDMTISILKDFGIEVRRSDDYSSITVPGRQKFLRHKVYPVDGDFSAAAFFLAAAALGAEISVANLPLAESARAAIQPDSKIIEILDMMGAKNRIMGNDAIKIIAPKRLNAIKIDVSDIPDLVPVLAALASVARGMSVIENAGRLRYKESDRLSAIAAELTKLGAKIIEKEDMLLIEGVPELTGGDLSAHNDHRIAMAIAVAAIYADGDVTLDRPDVVEKSYPGFWGDFGKVGMD